ncbi:MAG: CHASE4 domain-containing protein [Bdellovibrionota bacterium]
MQLRTKILLFIFVTMSALIGSLQWLLSSVLLEKFSQLELASLSKDVRRAQKALAGEPHQLALKQRDWSRSDDSYQFAADQNAQFIRSNLNSFALANLELYDIAFFRADGSLSFDLRQHALGAAALVDIDDELADEMNRHPELLQPDVDSREGFFVLPSGILAFSIQQVLPSSGGGAPRGSILFTRLVDDAFIERLAEQLELPLAVMRTDMLPQVDAARFISPEFELSHRILNPTTIQGFGVLRDSFGKRSLVVSLTERRDIYQQGKATLAALFVALVVAGLIVMILIGTSIERMIIKRLNSVANQVELIACSVDSSQTVTVEGEDELGVVASSINTMLHSLHTAEKQLREAAPRSKRVSGAGD